MNVVRTADAFVPWPFGDLNPLTYEVIVCDPPWDFANYSDKGTLKGADPHYDVMPLAQILALPVGMLARGDAMLLLWGTAPMLPQQIEVMRCWGFAYKTHLIWRKTTARGKVRVGTGYVARSMHEIVLVGTIGQPRLIGAFPSLFDGIAREHSRKPDEFYELVGMRTVGARRADLFSRQRRSGFDAWGREADKFEAVA